MFLRRAYRALRRKPNSGGSANRLSLLTTVWRADTPYATALGDQTLFWWRSTQRIGRRKTLTTDRLKSQVQNDKGAATFDGKCHKVTNRLRMRELHFLPFFPETIGSFPY